MEQSQISVDLGKYRSVLVTGATGSFGKQIVKDLLAQGLDCNVRLMARNEHRLLEQLEFHDMTPVWNPGLET